MLYATLSPVRLRQLQKRMGDLYRATLLRVAIRQISSLQPHETPGESTLHLLRQGWGNQDYSARLDYLSEMARLASHAEGPILECGSGITTLLLGLTAGRRGIQVHTLEHLEEWYQRISVTLRRFKIPGVHVHLVPLFNYGVFTWYSLPKDSIPKSFHVVICDGPPEATDGGRYGLLPLMQDHLGEGALILFDDANTQIGSKVLRRWETEWRVTVQSARNNPGTFALVKHHKTVGSASYLSRRFE